MEPKYPALKMISNIYRTIGWIAIFMTIGSMIIGVATVIITGGYLGGGIFAFFGSLLGAAFGSIVVIIIYTVLGTLISLAPFAVAEVIDVFIDIEGNTRS